LTGSLYGGVDFVDERHRHRYEVCLFVKCDTLLIVVLHRCCQNYCCWQSRLQNFAIVASLLLVLASGTVVVHMFFIVVW